MLLVTAKARLASAQARLKKAEKKLAAQTKYVAKVKQRIKDRKATVAKLQQSSSLGRLKPAVVVSMNVVCQSARTGTANLIVLHDTESHNTGGNADLQAIGNFFNVASTQASSHVATDADGNSARYVPDARKAWHVAAFNSASLGIEQIGFASQTSWPDAQLKETARWIAEWSIAHGIPIQKGAVSGSTVTKAGVLRHMDLGTAGGGHHDPGTPYPFDQVLALAQKYKTARGGK